MVRNNKNNQLIAFEPLMVTISKSLVNFVVILCILIIILVPGYFYYDEIKSKFMEFYANGFSLRAIFGKKGETIKYSNLSDNYY